MERKEDHYSSRFPDANLKIHTVSESLRRHLYIFKTTTGVFSYKKMDLGTKVFIEYMYIPEKPSVLLDIGCGYGPIGIVLAYNSLQSKIYMIDINTRAVWCARENIKINLSEDRKRVKVFSDNYLDPFKKRNMMFDGVYMNPPIRQGRKEFLNLISEIPKYLNPGGSFQFVLKKKLGAAFILQYLKENFPDQKIDIVCKKSGYWVFRCFHD